MADDTRGASKARARRSKFWGGKESEVSRRTGKEGWAGGQCRQEGQVGWMRQPGRGEGQDKNAPEGLSTWEVGSGKEKNANMTGAATPVIVVAVEVGVDEDDLEQPGRHIQQADEVRQDSPLRKLDCEVVDTFAGVQEGPVAAKGMAQDLAKGGRWVVMASIKTWPGQPETQTETMDSWTTQTQGSLQQWSKGNQPGSAWRGSKVVRYCSSSKNLK